VSTLKKSLEELEKTNESKQQVIVQIDGIRDQLQAELDEKTEAAEALLSK
jgi:hypothetical protein